MIERFTKEQFEQVLPRHKITGSPLWDHLGIDQGEHTYQVVIPDTNKRIMIRSSIGRNGVAADTGKNSIRLWVQYWYKDAWLPLGKLDRWTTRVPGWDKRMVSKLRELWRLALEDSKWRLALEDSKGYTATGATEGNCSVAPVGPEGEKVAQASDTPSGLDEAGDATSISPELSEVLKTSDTSPAFDLGEEHHTQEQEQDLVPPVPPLPPGPTPSPQQVAVIEAPVDRAMRVLAGPGSGKTFSLALRYSYLLANGARPQDIVAVTFSNPMATALLERITRINPEVTGTQGADQICTIHALCYRMLRAEGDKRRVPKHWQVKKILQEVIEDVWTYVDDRPGYREVLAFINTAKARGLTSADDLQLFGTVVDCNGRNVGHELHETRKRFDERMKRQGLITFADMPFAIEIRLKTDRAFREKYQARFQWVIVDEGQDTTGQAMEILTTLAKPQDQFTIVGDADQLLYRFINATPERNLYQGFEEQYPEGLTFKLETNYRSTVEIVEAQLRLIAHNYDDQDGPYEQRYFKTLIPRDGASQGEPVTFNEYEMPEHEALALVNALRENFANGREPGDFFVAARTRNQLGYLEGPLTKAKIPFINIAGGSFWTSKHVGDVLGYLRLAYDEENDEAFQRVFNIGSRWNTHPWGKDRGEYCQHRYLGKAFLAACGESYKGLSRAYNRKRSFQPGIKDLQRFVQELQAEMAANDTPAPAIEFIVDECYKRYLMVEEGITGDDESQNGKLEDLNTVIEIACQFGTVEEFLAYVDEAIKAAEAAKDKDWDGYVVLSTVHRLKGLERPVVYGVGLSEGHFDTPGPPVRAGLLPHTFSMTPPPQNGVLPTGGMARMEDERCVAFVLVSRAMEEVHLSGVKRYRKSILSKSRFVEEMITTGVIK